jgi:BolA protein
MSRYERIKTVLTAQFAPSSLEIIDESAKHAHHAAQKNVTGGETHYHIMMISEVLAGQSRLARQRAVNAALAAEFSTGLHAISMILRSPAEASPQPPVQ